MSKRHRERYFKAFVNDSGYFKMSESLKKLANQLRSSEEEVKRLRRENDELQKSKKVLQESKRDLEERLDEVNEQSKAKLKRKEQRITHLTTELKSARNTLKEKLNKTKCKNEEQKKVVDDVQCLDEEQNEMLTDSKTKLEATEEVNSQLQAKLEETERQNLNNKFRDLEKESMFLAACARTNAVIHDNGMDDTINERNSDLSDEDDNPPFEHLMQSDIDYNSIVVAKTDQSEINYNSIVAGAEIDNNVGQNPDSEDHCRLSFDDADKPETVPPSAYSIKPNDSEVHNMDSLLDSIMHAVKIEPDTSVLY